MTTTASVVAQILFSLWVSLTFLSYLNTFRAESLSAISTFYDGATINGIANNTVKISAPCNGSWDCISKICLTYGQGYLTTVIPSGRCFLNETEAFTVASSHHLFDVTTYVIMVGSYWQAAVLILALCSRLAFCRFSRRLNIVYFVSLAIGKSLGVVAMILFLIEWTSMISGQPVTLRHWDLITLSFMVIGFVGDAIWTLISLNEKRSSDSSGYHAI